MGNISDEINIIDAEIKKTEKAILKEVEGYKEVKRENLNHFKRYNDIPPKAKIFKETRKILVDAMLNGGKDLEAHKHTIKALQSRLNTLKQSRENKLNKIVFREDLEEVDKLQKEAEELKQRRAELSAKYAKPNPQDTPVSTPQDTAKHQAQVTPKDIKEIYYDDKKGKLFVDKIPANLTPTEKVFFEYFWDHKNITVTVDDLIEYMITSGGSSNASWDRGYFGKTLSSVNCKGTSLGVKKLIHNVVRGKKEYEISIRVIKKTFKP